MKAMLPVEQVPLNEQLANRWADWLKARLDTPGVVLVTAGAGNFA